jgi:hypothetical protein
MKHLMLSIIALAMFVSGVNAQTVSGRKKGIQAESSFVFAGASHWALGGRQTIGYCINPDWYVGVGAGFISNLNPSGNDVNIAPLYLNARWYWKDRRWSPFVDMSAGYAFATSTGTGGGAYVAPLVGINYHIKGRLSLDLGLGYLYEGCTYYGMAFNQHSPEIRIGLRY